MYEHGGAVNPTNNLSVEWANWYLSQGAQPVPIPPGSKAPVHEGWQKRQFQPHELPATFTGQNVGLRLGEPSGGLADVDLDSQQAVALGGTLLPPTGWVGGRPGKSRSHFFYRAAGATTRKFQDPIDSSMIVELRSTGGQTVVHPSIHPTGEQYTWEPGEIIAQTLATVDEGVLLSAVQHIAAASLLAKYWPGTGGRHNVALALAGALLQSGITADIARCVISCAAWAAGDAEYKDRAGDVDSTAARFAKGESVVGWKDAQATWGPVLPKVVEWLGGHPGGVVTGPDGRPVIPLLADESITTDAAAKALGNAEGVYQRGGLLVHVVRDSHKPRNIIRPEGSPRIVALKRAGIQTALTRVATFQSVKALKDGTIKREQAHPARWLSEAVAALGAWPSVKPLEGFVEFPVMRADGTLLTTPGYDDTGLFYEPSAGLTVTVPDAPTIPQVHQARDWLLDVVRDFPFAKPEHRSVWIAALLTPLARYAYAGPSPLFLFDANVPGVGKTLLADTIGVALTGRPCPRTPHTDDDAEWRKRLLAIGLAGDPLILIDNVSGLLGTPALDAALTSETWSDRLLATNETPTVPLRPLWMATGNNVELAGDTPRRTLHVRLESRLELPETRTGFNHPDLLGYIREYRGTALSAALTVLRGFHVAGRPDQNLPPWGSYEGWSGLVRQALVWCQMEDPCLTKVEGGSSRSEAERLIVGLLEIQQAFVNPQGQPTPLSAGQIIKTVETEYHRFHQMRDVLTEFTNSRSLGRALRRARLRVVGGNMLDSVERAGQHWWFVRVV